MKSNEFSEELLVSTYLILWGYLYEELPVSWLYVELYDYIRENI